MKLVFHLAIFLCAIGSILSYWFRRPVFVYVLKPLTTLLIIALAVSNFSSDRYTLAILIGLLFSLAGDIFLMLPRDRFLHGLISFLVAHIAYIVAFTTGTHFASRLLPFVLWCVPGAAILFFLWPAIRPELKFPVLIYVGFLIAMAGQAAARFIDLRTDAAFLACIGGALFVMSDAILAIDKFRKPFETSKIFVLGFYFVAQWLIALSVVV